MVSIEEFEQRFSKLKEVDHGKDRVIEKLIREVRELDRGLTDVKLHLEREKQTTILYQSKHSVAERRLKNMEGVAVSNGFVSVLIDGDSMPFLDHLVKSAKEGGMKAARYLRSKACKYVSNELDLPRNIQVRVRVYANIKGLASTYYHSKILDRTTDLDMFLRGFNMEHPMADFVDAGDGKECADSKLKAWFDHDIADFQCRAVIFGGSTDNGYARLLQPYVGDDSKNKPIILIEGPPFVKELAELKSKFLVASFPDIFRDTKLPTRRVSFSTTPPTTPFSGAVSYACITKPVGAAMTRPDDVFPHPETVAVRRHHPVLLNSKGQRLDAKIRPPQALVKVLRDRKLCNQFHILGECHYIGCVYEHGPRLDDNKIEARRFIARHNSCFSGLYCIDEKCLSGHECSDKACAKIEKGCRFTLEMHNVDRT